jgi:hypothetical protein
MSFAGAFMLLTTLGTVVLLPLLIGGAIPAVCPAGPYQLKEVV